MNAAPPASWVELESKTDWDRVRGLGGVIVISDDAEGAPRYHGRGCPFLTFANFKEKVVDRREAGLRSNGRYFWAATATGADAGGARACQHPGDPLNN